MGRNHALIVAAGKGTRMGKNIKKQFIEIYGKPVLYYTLKAFSDCNAVDEIVLVLSGEDIEYCRREIINKYAFSKVTKIIEGGEERQDSVFRGIQEMGVCDIVLIHDGARPFINEDIIVKGVQTAARYGASACGVKPKDTIKIKDQNGFSAATPDRNELFAVQTPQCFRYEVIKECHLKLQEDNIKVTDDTMLVERYGYKVYLYEGDYRNIKITTPEDILIAEVLLKHKNVNGI